MNETNSQRKISINASPPRGFQTQYTVPRDYDQTQNTLLPLDHYLLDKDVYFLVKELFTDVQNWGKWAVDYPHDSSSYFSPPYTSQQAYLLGYEKSDNNTE